MAMESQVERVGKLITNLKVILAAAVAVLAIVIGMTIYLVNLKNQFDGYERRIAGLEKQIASLAKLASWSTQTAEGGLYAAARGAGNFPADCPQDTYATGLRVWGSDAAGGAGNVSQIRLVCRRLNVQ
jgi:hypothetical protein